MEIEDAELLDFESGSKFRVSPVEPREKDDGLLGRESHVVAVANGLVFIHEATIYFHGGVHPNRSARFYAFDLHTNSESDWFSPAEWESFFEADRERATVEYLAGDEYAEPIEFGRPQITELRPIVSGTGLGLEVQVTFPTCYAASDGKWASYTRSWSVKATSVPKALAETLAPPPRLAKFVERFDGGEVVGWSRVPATVEAERWLSHIKKTG